MTLASTAFLATAPEPLPVQAVSATFLSCDEISRAKIAAVETKNLFVGIMLLVILGWMHSANAAFPARYAGTYGLFPSVDGDGDEMRGKITVTATGAFTGKVEFRQIAETVIGTEASGYHFFGDSVLTPISGQFNDGGSTTLTLEGVGFSSTTYLRLTFSKLEPGVPVISGDWYDKDDHIIGGTIFGSFSAHKVAPAGSLAGRYTMALRSKSELEYAPKGHGWAVVTVKPNGRFVARGRLAIGKPFLMSAFMRAGGQVWFDADRHYYHNYYHSSAGGTQVTSVYEELSGLLTVRENSETTDIEGQLRWRYRARWYSSGERLSFPQAVTVEASRYRPPAPGKLIFGNKEEPTPGSGVQVGVNLTSGGLAEPGNASFRLLSRGNLQVAKDLAEPLTSLRFNYLGDPAVSRADGTFDGTIQIPGEATQRKFYGIILQKQNRGSGFFKGSPETPHTTGALSMEPVFAEIER